MPVSKPRKNKKKSGGSANRASRSGNPAVRRVDEEAAQAKRGVSTTWPPSADLFIEDSTKGLEDLDQEALERAGANAEPIIADLVAADEPVSVSLQGRSDRRRSRGPAHRVAAAAGSRQDCPVPGFPDPRRGRRGPAGGRSPVPHSFDRHRTDGHRLVVPRRVRHQVRHHGPVHGSRWSRPLVPVGHRRRRRQGRHSPRRLLHHLRAGVRGLAISGRTRCDNLIPARTGVRHRPGALAPPGV